MGISATLALGALALVPERPLPNVPIAHPSPPDERFDDYVWEKEKQARKEGVLPGNEEEFVRRSEKPTPLAFLYIHGFGASRAEGEYAVEMLAAMFAANAYYLRLPGHGGDKDAHAAARAEEYFACVEDAFHRVRPLGEKLVVFGSSAGGLLSVWLASRHPDDVAGLVLANPFFAFSDPTAFLLSRRAGMPIIETLYGKERDAGWRSDPEHRKYVGYEEHWITKQHFRALNALDDLRRVIATPEVMSKVQAPILLFYYYADEAHQDRVASVPAMHDFFAQAHGGTPHPLSKKVAIADGNHILLSAYVRTDKALINLEGRNFLGAILGPEK